jgi:hypothetical protein
MRLAERPYRHGLSNLTGTIDDKWLVIGIPVPLFQITINLSFKQIHNDNHIFWLQIYNKNHIFGAFYPTFFTFPSIFLLLPLILDYMFLHTIVVNLRHIGYYRFSAYLYPLLTIPKENHVFKPGAAFNQALPRAFLCRFP